MGFFNFVYIFYLARYLLCSQCKGGVFVSNVNLSVIVTCCKPKRNTSCQRGGGKHKTVAKVGISLPLSASRFSSLDSLFPQPPLLLLLPTFILSSQNALRLLASMVWAVGDASPYNSFFERIIKKESEEKICGLKSKSRRKGGRSRKGSAEGKTKEGGEVPTFTAVLCFSPFLWFPLCIGYATSNDYR